MGQYILTNVGLGRIRSFEDSWQVSIELLDGTTVSISQKSAKLTRADQKVTLLREALASRVLDRLEVGSQITLCITGSDGKKVIFDESLVIGQDQKMYDGY